MRIPESCARCMYDRQAHRVPDEEYLKRVKEIIDNREENDASPYLVYLFKFSVRSFANVSSLQADSTYHASQAF